MFAKLAIAVAAFAAVANGAACPPTEISLLVPLASNTNIAPCTAVSGFNLIPPTGLPTDDQLKKMCVSDACKNVISAVKALNPNDCDLTVGSVTLNVHSLVNNFASDCARVAGTTAPPATTPAATTAAPTPGATTTTPATTTPATTTPAPESKC